MIANCIYFKTLQDIDIHHAIRKIPSNLRFVKAQTDNTDESQ